MDNKTWSDPLDARVLLVDAHEQVRGLVGGVFRLAGLRVGLAGSAAEARHALTTNRFDLVVLDPDLPDAQGLDLLAEIRAAGVSVIIVSARHSEADRVSGLQAGADDYVLKPFSSLELLARARAVLRTFRRAPVLPVVHGNLVIDVSSRQVFLDGTDLELTRREFDLLLALARRPGRTFSRKALLREVWGTSSQHWGRGSGTVTEHVRRLRRKLNHGATSPGAIVTVRGVGYRFVPEQERHARPALDVAPASTTS